MGTCPNVHTLAGMNGTVYAAQEGTNSLVRILPDNETLGLATAWGIYAEKNDPGAEPLLSFSRGGSPSGFVVSPKETRKLFVTCPELNHAIISVKDYDFRKWMKDFRNDFIYPDKKPVGTFRILLVGDSRIGSAMLPPSPDKLKDGSFDLRTWDRESTMRTNTFGKQLEFVLNAEAALNGVKNHFEVLTLSQDGTSSSSLIPNPALDLVKKMDVDLILALSAWSTYFEFFGMPLTEEGLPGPLDAEYMLKPLSERVAPGVTRHFYELCKKKNLVSEDNGRYMWNINWTQLESMDPEIKKDLMELTSRPFRVFQNKLQSLKTPGAGRKKLLMLFIPWRNWPNSDSYENFWKDICSEYHLDLLDLSEPYLAMKTSFYPTDQKGWTHHYLPYGSSLIAMLLSHYLTEQKWVPFEPEKKTGSPGK